MPDSKDYRLYLDQRFDGLNTLMNAHFINVKDTLDAIKTQTEKTNGRVTEVEDDLKAFKEIANKAIADGKHVIDSRVTECPNIKRFEKLEIKMEGLEHKLETDVKDAQNEFRADSKILKETLQDAMFFIRHPKVFMGIIVFFVLASIFTLYQTIHEAGLFRETRFEMNSTKIEAQKINDMLNEIQTRGVSIKKDSIK